MLQRTRKDQGGIDKLTSSVIGMWGFHAYFDLKMCPQWAPASTYWALRPLSCSASPRLQVNLSIPSGLQCKLVTGGGSGSVEIDIDAAVLTELQCGSYALMDADYLSVLRTNGDSLETLFSPALFVITSVISVRSPNYVVIDAGLKSMGLDSGPPIVCSNANLLYRNPSDEHGVLFAPEITTLPFLGERLHLIPSHCDPTIALHDRLYAVKDGRVDAIWSIVGRGEW